LQVFRVRFGDDGDFVFLSGGPEKGGADDEIAETP